MKLRVEGLKPGQVYRLQARSIDSESKRSEWSESYEYTAPIDTTAPANADTLVVNFAESTFVATWSDTPPRLSPDFKDFKVTISNDSGYSDARVYYSPTPRFEFPLEVNRKEFTTPQATLYIKVQSRDTSNNESSGVTGSGTNPSPSAPTGTFTATGLSQAYSVNVAGLTGKPNDYQSTIINMYDASSGGAATQILEGTDSALIYQTTNYSTKYLTAQYKDVFGLIGTETSPRVSVTALNPVIVDTTPPSTPTGIAASWVGTVFRVTFNQVADAARYELTITRSGGADSRSFGLTATGDAVQTFNLTVSDNSAAWGSAQKTLRASVKAIDTYGNTSAASSFTADTTYAVSVPAVGTPAAVAANYSYLASWDADTSDAKSYTEVAHAASSGGTLTTVWQGSGISAIVSATSIKYVKIRHVNVFGDFGAYSAEIPVTPTDPVLAAVDVAAPAAVTSITRTFTGTDYVINFSKPADTDLRDFVIILDTSPTDPKTVTQLADPSNTAQVYTLDFDKNKSLWGTAKSTISATIKARDNVGNINAGAAVTSITATDNTAVPTGGSVNAITKGYTVSWTKPAWAGYSYTEVHDSSSLGGTYTAVWTGTDTTASISRGTDYTTRYVKIRHYDVFGRYKEDAAGTAVTPIDPAKLLDTTAPANVTNVARTFTGTDLVITWDKPADTDLSSFVITLNNGSTDKYFTQLADTANTSQTFTLKLADNIAAWGSAAVTISGSIKAKDFAGNVNTGTAISSITATNNLTVPANVKLQAQVSSYTVTWDKPTFTGYWYSTVEDCSTINGTFAGVWSGTDSSAVINRGDYNARYVRVKHYDVFGRFASNNLLTTNQATLEDNNTTGWSADGATITAVTPAYAGTYAIQATTGATSSTYTGIVPTTNTWAAVAGETYHLEGWFKLSNASRSAKLIIQSLNGGTPVAAPEVLGSMVGGTWTFIQSTITTPANTTQVKIYLRSTSTTAALSGETIQWDSIGFWAGSAGTWAAPPTTHTVTPINPVSADTTAPTVVTAGLSSSSAVDTKDVSGQTVIVTANWTGVADSDVAGYKVKFSQTNNSTSAGTVVDVPNAQGSGTGSKSAVFYGVTGQTYYWWVASYDYLNNISAWSATQTTVATTDTTAPATPTNLALTVKDNNINATWTGSATGTDFNPALGIGYYKVELATDSGFTANYQYQRASSTAISFAVPLWSTTYYVKVSAVDTSGNISAATANVTAATGIDPARNPQGMALNEDPSMADANAWTVTLGAAGTFTTVTDGQTGPTVLRSGSGLLSNFEATNYIPLDPSKYYRITMWVRSSGGSTKNMYLGLSLKSNGTVVKGAGTWWSYALGNAIAANSTWTQYGLNVKYTPLMYPSVSTTATYSSGGGAGSSSVTISAPNTDIRVGQLLTGTGFAANTYVSGVSGTSVSFAPVASSQISGTLTFTKRDNLTMSPLMYLNYNNIAGYIEVNDVRIEEVMGPTLIQDDAITTPKIVAGAITASKFAADNALINQTLRIGDTGANQINLVAGSTGIAGKVYSGSSGVYNNTNTGFYLDGGGNFSLKDKLSFDGTTLTVNGTIQAAAGYFSGNLAVGNGGTMKIGVDVNGTNDGIYIDANNYWYNTGNMSIGSATDNVTWNGTTLAVTGNITAKGGSFTGNIQANGGSFYAGSLPGSGQRLIMNSSGITGYNSGGTAQFTLTTDGALTATSATITGAINATSGSILNTMAIGNAGTAGTLTLGYANALTLTGGTAAGSIKGGQSDYNTGTGFFLGYSGGYKFSIGNPAADNLTWNGSNLSISGNLTLTGITIDRSGKIYTTGKTYGTSTAGYILDYNAGTPVMELSNAARSAYLQWTGADLIIRGNITADAGYIGGATGWTITTGKMYSGSGVSFTGVLGGTGTSFFAGATDNAGTSAKFSVTAAGAISATSGTIGGITLGTTKIHTGVGTFNSADTGFYVDSSGQFSLENKLSWNGTTLTLQGNLTADSGTFNGNILMHSTAGSIYSGTISGSGSTAVITGDGYILNNTGLSFYDGGVSKTSIVAATGALTTTSASIGGWTVDSSTIQKTVNTGTLKLDSVSTTPSIVTVGGATTAGLTASTTDPGDPSETILFVGATNYAGRATAPFRVTTGGALTATSATITGAITATSGFFTGPVNATSGTFAGNIGVGGALVASLMATVTNKALTTNVVTLTTLAAHGMTTGDVVWVSINDATFDGQYTLASGSGTTMTYAKTATNVTSVAVTPNGYVTRNSGTRVALTNTGITGYSGANTIFQLPAGSGTAATIGGWIFDDTKLYSAASGTNNVTGLIKSTTSGDITIFAGANDNVGGGAKFSVTAGGLLTATAGSIGNSVTIGGTAASTVASGAAAGAVAPIVYRQPAAPAPTGPSGSIWYDTDDSNKTYILVGGAWQITEIDKTGIGLGSVENKNAKDQAESGLITGTTITGGGITLSGGGSIKGGQTDYNTGTGFFLGYSTGYKFSIGNSAGDSLTWNGTTLNIKGTITADYGTIGGATGWNIGAGKIYSGSGSSFTGVMGGIGTAFFAGATDNAGANAKFSVTAAGSLSATNATISGIVGATELYADTGKISDSIFIASKNILSENQSYGKVIGEFLPWAASTIAAVSHASDSNYGVNDGGGWASIEVTKSTIQNTGLSTNINADFGWADPIGHSVIPVGTPITGVAYVYVPSGNENILARMYVRLLTSADGHLSYESPTNQGDGFKTVQTSDGWVKLYYTFINTQATAAKFQLIIGDNNSAPTAGHKFRVDAMSVHLGYSQTWKPGGYRSGLFIGGTYGGSTFSGIRSGNDTNVVFFAGGNAQLGTGTNLFQVTNAGAVTAYNMTLNGGALTTAATGSRVSISTTDVDTSGLTFTQGRTGTHGIGNGQLTLFNPDTLNAYIMFSGPRRGTARTSANELNRRAYSSLKLATYDENQASEGDLSTGYGTATLSADKVVVEAGGYSKVTLTVDSSLTWQPILNSGSTLTSTATSVTGTQLSKTAAGWTADNLIGSYVLITAGTGITKNPVLITDNGTTTIIVSAWSNGTPDATSTFVVVGSSTSTASDIILLQNSWAAYDASETTFSSPRYRKMPDGTVKLKGLIKDGTTTSPTVLFTLPAGYRPTKNCIFIAKCSPDNTGIARIDVATNGNVSLANYSGTPATYVSLDGINFDTV